MTTQAYNLMVERILEDSFLPRANMDFSKVNSDKEIAEMENDEARKECNEVLNRIPGFTWTDTRLDCTVISTVQ